MKLFKTNISLFAYVTVAEVHKLQREPKRGRGELLCLTFHLFDTAQRVFQRVHRAGFPFAPLLRRLLHLQLLERLEKLLLCLSFGRQLAAAGRT